MKLTATDWTVVARSSVPGHWHYAAHWSGDMLAKASDANQIIAMHRKTEHGWEIVARLAGPYWQSFQRRGRAARRVFE